MKLTKVTEMTGESLSGKSDPSRRKRESYLSWWVIVNPGGEEQIQALRCEQGRRVSKLAGDVDKAKQKSMTFTAVLTMGHLVSQGTRSNHVTIYGSGDLLAKTIATEQRGERMRG